MIVDGGCLSCSSSSSKGFVGFVFFLRWEFFVLVRVCGKERFKGSRGF